jgi:DNA-binding NarL/FixJ family response regulator
MKRLGILIADEDQSVRRCLRKSVERHLELEVRWEADNGLEALLLARQEQPNAVIMDARLPRMDGLEVTRCLRAANNQVCIVLMSAYEEHRAEALAAGADAFVLKDACREALNSTILQIVNCGNRAADAATDAAKPDEDRL